MVPFNIFSTFQWYFSSLKAWQFIFSEGWSEYSYSCWISGQWPLLSPAPSMRNSSTTQGASPIITDCCIEVLGPTILLTDRDMLYVPGSLYWWVTSTNSGNVRRNPSWASERKTNKIGFVRILHLQVSKSQDVKNHGKIYPRSFDFSFRLTVILHACVIACTLYDIYYIKFAFFSRSYYLRALSYEPCYWLKDMTRVKRSNQSERRKCLFYQSTKRICQLSISELACVKFPSLATGCVILHTLLYYFRSKSSNTREYPTEHLQLSEVKRRRKHFRRASSDTCLPWINTDINCF